jgi:hypothetical protein
VNKEFLILYFFSHGSVSPFLSYFLFLFVFFHASNKNIALPWASCHLDFAGVPVNFWVVLMQLRVSNNKCGFTEVTDLEHCFLFVPFV